jgi:glycosyltransferase involved in cell wall biosynthesis
MPLCGQAELSYHIRMVQRGGVPCSALSFVRNGGADFEKCLISANFCQEHIVVDGHSTDQTLELAKTYGCTVIPQDQRFLNAAGRIIDFSGITNQAIAAAHQPWMLLISADEELDAELRESIERACQSSVPAVYLFRRVVLINGRPIRSSMSSGQIRLFHREAIDGFVKRVHERPKLRTGIHPQYLAGIQYVPFPPASQMKPKHNHYIALEIASLPPHFGFFAWCSFAFQKLIRVGYRCYQIIVVRCTQPWHECLPLAYEWLDIRYPLLLIWRAFWARCASSKK